MGLGRRKIRLEQADAWVFNKMAHVYDARPAYPVALVDALAALVEPGARVADIGAGIGHLSLPLAARGFRVAAIEPAAAMLARLRDEASERGLRIEALHAAAEGLPLVSESVELAVIADALHFLDAELTGLELSRVLVRGGALAFVTSELGDTPFMRALVEVMHEAAPRRPREIGGAMLQVSRVAGVTLGAEQRFHDEVPVSAGELERILRSISFIGPAMNEARFTAFRARILAIPGERAWARTFTLHAGTKR